MHRRPFLALLAGTSLPLGAAPNDAALWQRLRGGGHVLLMRHAATDPGIGDPPGFVLERCASQRNLSDAGRRDARRIGDALRRRGIPIGEVLSSRWCRCLDTARLVFGRADPAPMLDSMFRDEDARRRPSRCRCWCRPAAPWWRKKTASCSATPSSTRIQARWMRPSSIPRTRAAGSPSG